MQIQEIANILYERLNYKFQNLQLLQTALTHPSDNKFMNYQRLEFLGDGILHAVICDLIYNLNASLEEGIMSRIYAKLVNSSALAEIARSINLGDLLFLEKSEELLNGRNHKRNLENAMEALIGAIYIDSNYQEIHRIISMLWADFLAQPIAQLEQRDFKSMLQEWTQKNIKVLPLYNVISCEGESHAPTFVIECLINGILESDLELRNNKSVKNINNTTLLKLQQDNKLQENQRHQVLYKTLAEGKSKKEAEQKAAEQLLNCIKFDGLMIED